MRKFSGQIAFVYSRFLHNFSGAIDHKRKFTGCILMDSGVSDIPKEPTMYNGVLLPSIENVWTDKETYPYAVIISHPNGDYSLVLQSFEMYVQRYNNGGETLVTEGNSGVLYAYRGGTKWTPNGEMNYNLTLIAGDTGEVHGTPLWASYDLKYVDEPVEPDIPSTATQYLYGQVAPSTVSYNGVVLPDIEAVWTDEQTYPYAWIEAYDAAPFGYEGATVGFLVLTSNKPAYNANDGFVLSGKMMQYTYTNNEQLASEFGLSANVWDLSGSAENDTWTYEIYDVKTYWTSHDILNTDGSVYLAASDPVKSYDADVIVDGVGYKGLVLPAVPERDEKAYPYLVFGLSYALASATPFNVTGGMGTYARPSGTYLSSKYYWDKNGEYWGEWEEKPFEESVFNMDYVLLSDRYFWYTNHDLYYADGTLYASAHDEPVPVELPITMFDGELTTKSNSYGYTSAGFISLCGWSVGDTVRVTINGVTEEHTVRVSKRNSTSCGGVIGNEVLTDYADSDVEDSGGDWCIDVSMRLSATDNPDKAHFVLYTRTAGTYQLKIERIAIAKE